ncbi:MAG: hypothetical protein JWO06_1816 [Bacteroidota bacterium]|nr:hypothetical protein [Bacteroidota bacterium]
MKRNLLALIVLACLSTQLNAQYFTVRLAGGYAWPGLQNSESVSGPKIDPLNPDIDALAPLSTINDSIPSTKSVRGSFGKGMNFTLGLGYMINPYFGVDLGISYLKSATITADQTRQLTVFTGINYSYIPYYLDAKFKCDAVGVSLNPSLIVQAPFKKVKLTPYARLGISLPIAGGLTDHISIDQNAPGGHFAQVLDTLPYYLGRHTEVTLKTQGTVSLGVNGAIGLKYDALPYLSVFFEINGQYLVTRAKSAQITQWDATDDNGVTTSLINQRGVYRTQFNFVDELNNNSNNKQYNAKYDPTKPKDDIRPTGALSNLGLNIGLTFNLGKQTLKKKTDKPADADKSK